MRERRREGDAGEEGKEFTCVHRDVAEERMDNSADMVRREAGGRYDNGMAVLLQELEGMSEDRTRTCEGGREKVRWKMR
eukprot:749620-Hanusia_phi.AAC.1